METLPDEIIEYILTDPNLSVVDVVNFGSTCSKYRELVALASTAWKSKYLQCWPSTDEDVVVSDWYNECITRKNFEQKALELLSTMSSKFYHFDIEDISSTELEFVIDFVNSHKYGYYYLRDFLIKIISLPLSQSLTNKYYGSILLKYINKKHYSQIWSDLQQLDPKEQTLEKGAIFVTYWDQENEKRIIKAVTSDLDHTALLVKNHLLQKQKEHPLKNTPEEMQETWRRENITDNMFSPVYCKSILESIKYVLFEQLKYCIMYDLNKEVIDFEKKKWGIDYAVLDRRATPLIFAVIFESIARRLGVRVEVLVFLDHCLLKWKEQYSVEDSPYYYISMSNEEVFMRARRCPRARNNDPVIKPCNMQKIAERAASVYIQESGENRLSIKDAMELLLVINPYDLETYDRFCQYYRLFEMDARDLISKLPVLKSRMSEFAWHFEPIVHSLKKYQKIWEREHNHHVKTKPQHRVDRVEFAVGMIVRDKYLQRIGVICGWDKARKAPHRKEQVPDQPFYKILLEDGSKPNLPQEHLQILHSPPFIPHPFIGRFFEEFCTTYYKPNKELQEEYPDDTEALQKILSKDREA